MFIYEHALTQATCETCETRTLQVLTASIDSTDETADLVFTCLTCHDIDRITASLEGYSQNIRPHLIASRVSDTGWLVKNT